MKTGKIIATALFITGAFSLASAATAEVNFKRCIVCHGTKAEKVPPGGTIVSATLSKEELKKTLKEYKTNKEHGGKMKATMQLQVKPFSEEDLDALAEYIFTNFHIDKK
ncbi:MAG: c-type cytochrome [Campylobacteraceae bacterium]|jgi:cytochrome c|nr:c-type cytochrome [Campylobacteraceae bacterium]